MVERPDLAAEVNDTSSAVPESSTQERVWSALRRDLAHLGEVHGMEF
jgi:hypothetical protein